MLVRNLSHLYELLNPLVNNMKCANHNINTHCRPEILNQDLAGGLQNNPWRPQVKMMLIVEEGGCYGTRQWANGATGRKHSQRGHDRKKVEKLL